MNVAWLGAGPSYQLFNITVVLEIGIIHLDGRKIYESMAQAQIIQNMISWAKTLCKYAEELIKALLRENADQYFWEAYLHIGANEW